MSKDLQLLKTWVRPVLYEGVERVADRDQLSMAAVLRRYIREGLERDSKNGKP